MKFNWHGNKKLNQNNVWDNVKSLEKPRKHLELLKYFKTKRFLNGILFLQETLFIKESKIKCKDKFDGNLFFSHGKSNSCGVFIGFSGD